MSETNIVLEGENVVMKLASSFPDQKQKEMARNMFLVMNTKTIAGKNKDEARKFNAYEALSYVMACEELGLNPVLNHVIMLEDQFYITLQGHLQNAHKTGQLVGLTVDIVSDDVVPVDKWDWGTKKNIQIQTKQYKYKCTIEKKMGDHVATFSAYGVADITNVAGGEKKSSLQIEQMAEARAMRRCLARAFPVGLSNFEDVIDAQEIGMKIHESSSEAKAEAGKLMAGKKKAPSVKDAAAVKEAIENTPAGGVVFVDGDPSEIANAINAQAEETAASSQAEVYEKATEIKPEIVKPEPVSETDPAPIAQTAPATEEIETVNSEEIVEPSDDSEKIEELKREFEASEDAEVSESEESIAELEDKLMIARVEFNRALTAHRSNPTPENEAAKTEASAEVVRINRIIASRNVG